MTTSRLGSIGIVGTSLAGLRSAQELRAGGYDGTLVMIGAEAHRPYDRPPLSKEFLLGKADIDDLALAQPDEEAELAAHWRLGVRATRLDRAAGAIDLDDGSSVAVDGVVIATGSTPRTLPGAPAPESVTGLHFLRTVEDSAALRDELAEGQLSVVVIGAGFIGAEVAATCRALGHAVTVVEAMETPLLPILGPELSRVCGQLHGDNDVRLVCGVGVEEIETADSADVRSSSDSDSVNGGSVNDGSLNDGGRRVTGVLLADGRRLEADAVVVGIGVRPVVDWLADSGLEIDGGIRTDAGCRTNLPNVVAVGDVARYWNDHRNAYLRQEHWQNAFDQPAVAAHNLLAGADGPPRTYVASGYFWSEQYGVRIQYAGTNRPGDEVQVEDGSLDDRKFVATYRRDGEAVGVLAMNSTKLFIRLRKQIRAAQLAN